MLSKLTSKNQLTLPKAVVGRFPGVDYFEVETADGCIVLKPLRRSRADEARKQIEALGITQRDVGQAVEWARRTRVRTKK